MLNQLQNERENGPPPMPSALPRVSSRRKASELGHKGANTRGRLMSAAHSLIQTCSPVELTVRAIARHAGTSPGTFYVYFDDIPAMILALAEDAASDLGEVVDAIQSWRYGEYADGAEIAFRAFQAYWSRHRAVLNIRNMEADRGEPDFMNLRIKAGTTIIHELARVQFIHPRAEPSAESLARAAVIYAAIERLTATKGHYDEAPDDFLASLAAIETAQIALLRTLERPSEQFVCPGGTSALEQVSQNR